MEKTLVLIKPDAMKRNLAGHLIRRYLEAGMKIVGIKMVRVDKTLAELHYPASEKQIVGMGKKTIQSAHESGKPHTIMERFGTEDPKEIGMELRSWLIDFITSTPVIAMVLEGEDSIQTVRKITGFTDPLRAEKGTIRGDWGEDSIEKANEEKRATKNLVHASGNKEEADVEIKLWFSEGEIQKY